MHTLMVVSGGFVLLAICLLFARLAGKPLRAGAIAFLPLWFIGAGINLAVGMSHGYGFLEELVIFAPVFGIPAAVAAGVAWRRSAAP